jgi:exopolysaccharide biosynthesis polyprenyl glycosylphosphotransferase
MRDKHQIRKYLAGDILSSFLSWAFYYFFFIYHLQNGEKNLFYPIDVSFAGGLAAFTIFWLIIYFLSGFYHDVYRRSRLKELGKSFLVALAGTSIVFLYLISEDIISAVYRSFFRSYLSLFYIHFFFSYLFRLIITTSTITAINKGKIGFNTLIVGDDKKAVEIYHEINDQIRSTGNKFIGFISINGKNHYQLSEFLPHLGGLEALNEILKGQNVEEVILAIEPCEHSNIKDIIAILDQYKLIVRAIPGMYESLTGRVRLNTIIEAPLIRLPPGFLPAWQENLKQTLDVFISLFALILFLPVSIVIMIWIRFSSKGPVFYSHERIGLNGKPFMIYKFRTMIDGAEKNGPELSSDNDPRVTKAGRFLRRTRLDELPNFINVLKGDMSLVGPRPERRFYIDQIIKVAPHYNNLLKIKPGITSWGQVKFGYAENVDQMVRRLRYDLIYLQNMSVFVDFQILILTVLTIFKRNPHQQGADPSLKID